MIFIYFYKMENFGLHAENPAAIFAALESSGILRAGCNSPPAVIARERTPFGWSADTGEIPEPTVKVRMEENGRMCALLFRCSGLVSE